MKAQSPHTQEKRSLLFLGSRVLFILDHFQVTEDLFFGTFVID